MVTVSSHHALLKVGDMVAVKFAKENLERQIYPGERLTIDYSIKKSQVHEMSSGQVRSQTAKDHSQEHSREIGR